MGLYLYNFFVARLFVWTYISISYKPMGELEGMRVKLCWCLLTTAGA